MAQNNTFRTALAFIALLVALVCIRQRVMPSLDRQQPYGETIDSATVTRSHWIQLRSLFCALPLLASWLLVACDPHREANATRYVVVARPHDLHQQERLDYAIWRNKVLFVVAQLQEPTDAPILDIEAKQFSIAHASLYLPGKTVNLLREGGIYICCGQNLVAHFDVTCSKGEIEQLVAVKTPWVEELTRIAKASSTRPKPSQ
ncbi:MAG: hypothetical protein ACOYMN_11895 [Roseimicrobium sp.]